MTDRALRLCNPTELAVLTVLWEHGHATVPEVCYALSAVRLVPYTTVMIVLAHLVDTGLLCVEGARFPGYTYTPILTKAEVIAMAVRETLADLQPTPHERRWALLALAA